MIICKAIIDGDTDKKFSLMHYIQPMLVSNSSYGGSASYYSAGSTRFLKMQIGFCVSYSTGEAVVNLYKKLGDGLPVDQLRVINFKHTSHNNKEAVPASTDDYQGGAINSISFILTEQKINAATETIHGIAIVEMSFSAYKLSSQVVDYDGSNKHGAAFVTTSGGKSQIK